MRICSLIFQKFVFTYQPFFLSLILRKQSADMVIWHYPFSLQHQCQRSPFFILVFILPTALLLCSAAVTFQYELKTEKERLHFYSTKSEKGRNAKYFFLSAVSVDSFKCNKRRFCIAVQVDPLLQEGMTKWMFIHKNIPIQTQKTGKNPVAGKVFLSGYTLYLRVKSSVVEL